MNFELKREEEALASGETLLSSAIYSIYYSRYSTPYLSGEGEEGGLDGGLLW